MTAEEQDRSAVAAPGHTKMVSDATLEDFSALEKSYGVIFMKHARLRASQRLRCVPWEQFRYIFGRAMSMYRHRLSKAGDGLFRNRMTYSSVSGCVTRKRTCDVNIHRYQFVFMRENGTDLVTTIVMK